MVDVEIETVRSFNQAAACALISNLLTESGLYGTVTATTSFFLEDVGFALGPLVWRCIADFAEKTGPFTGVIHLEPDTLRTLQDARCVISDKSRYKD